METGAVKLDYYVLTYKWRVFFFFKRNLWMTDKLDRDARASMKSTLGVIKSSCSSQVKADASEPSWSHSDPQLCVAGEATGRLGALCPHRSPEPSGHRGFPLLKSPKLKQKLNSETKRGGPGCWLRSCFWWGATQTSESRTLKWDCVHI